jgi:hypothetical protein
MGTSLMLASRCGFVNAYGELGAASPRVAEVVRRHKDRLRAFLLTLVGSESPTDQFLMLVDGATISAMLGRPGAAETAKEAAAKLTGGSAGPAAGA